MGSSAGGQTALTLLCPMCQIKSPGTPSGSYLEGNRELLSTVQAAVVASLHVHLTRCHAVPPALPWGHTWLMAMTSLAFRIARLSG